MKIHEEQPLLTVGAPLGEARIAFVMLHGRGASAQSILSLAQEFWEPTCIYLAPQAAQNTWYPNRFLAPLASNEPWLTSALTTVNQIVQKVERAGIPSERTVLLGFSQGACLALEYSARFPQRYGGVVALSGALIENGDQPRDYSGSLGQTPIFLGCSTDDFHIPQTRVVRSNELLSQLDARVTMRLYPDLGHTVNQDELASVQYLIKELQSAYESSQSNQSVAK